MKHVGIRKKNKKKKVHLVGEIFAVILMDDGHELLEVASSNTFDQSILGFVIVSQIWDADMSAPGVASRYNLAIVSSTLDNFL